MKTKQVKADVPIGARVCYFKTVDHGGVERRFTVVYQTFQLPQVRKKIIVKYGASIFRIESDFDKPWSQMKIASRNTAIARFHKRPVTENMNECPLNQRFTEFLPIEFTRLIDLGHGKMRVRGPKLTFLSDE